VIDSNLYQQLQSAVATQVGGIGGGFSSGFSSGFADFVPGRIYPASAVQDSLLPYITYEITDRQPLLTLGGFTSVNTYNATVSVYAVNYNTASTIASNTITAMQTWQDSTCMIAIPQNPISEQLEFGFAYTITVLITARG